MLQFFTIVSWLCLITAQSQYFYKSASLSPLNTNDSGASISVIHNDVSTSEDGWDIAVNDEIGFHLLLSLNNEWGFHPTAISTITITIDSTSNISRYQDLDLLLLSFTSTNNEYFTTMINLDNRVANGIYPECNNDTNIITPLATGNILSLTMADNYTNSTLGSKPYNGERAWKSRGDALDTTNIPNEFPIILEIINDPILGYAQFRSKEEGNWGIWTQGCVYSAFRTDQGLSVYLAGDDGNNETLNIHDIFVEYEYDLNVTDLVLSASLDDALFDGTTSTMDEVIKESMYDENWMDLLLTEYLIYILIGIGICLCFCIVIFGVMINIKRKHKQKPSMYVIDSRSGKNKQIKHCVVEMSPQSLSGPVHLTLNNGFPTTSSNLGDNKQQSSENIKIIRLKSKTASTDFEDNINEFSFIGDTNYVYDREENVDLYMNEKVNDVNNVKKLKILKPRPVPFDALPLHKQLSLISVTTHSNHPSLRSQPDSPQSPTLSDEKSTSVSAQHPYHQLAPIYNRQISTLSTASNISNISNISHASDYDVIGKDQAMDIIQGTPTNDGMDNDEEDGDNPNIKRDEFIIKNEKDDELDVDTKGNNNNNNNNNNTIKQIEGEFEFDDDNDDDENGEDITPEPPSNHNHNNNK